MIEQLMDKIARIISDSEFLKRIFYTKNDRLVNALHEENVPKAKNLIETMTDSSRIKRNRCRMRQYSVILCNGK
ncbi:MAG TPA: hypothetical protein LFW20_06065 [Rickettsia endosymbiont of Omalisus fontisbellaquei]|nr:hypothetical protein [Rickettsia endosymbiont of Omalisus fontisbellaquei]